MKTFTVTITDPGFGPYANAQQRFKRIAEVMTGLHAEFGAAPALEFFVGEATAIHYDAFVSEVEK